MIAGESGESPASVSCRPTSTVLPWLSSLVAAKLEQMKPMDPHVRILPGNLPKSRVGLDVAAWGVLAGTSRAGVAALRSECFS